MNCLTITRRETEADRERKARILRNRRFGKVKIAIWSAFTGFCIGITPYCFQYANFYRESNAVGGEMFVPLLPVILYPMFSGMMNSIKERMNEYD